VVILIPRIDVEAYNDAVSKEGMPEDGNQHVLQTHDGEQIAQAFPAPDNGWKPTPENTGGATPAPAPTPTAAPTPAPALTRLRRQSQHHRQNRQPQPTSSTQPPRRPRKKPRPSQRQGATSPSRTSWQP
jgi:hypothetical protein